MAWIIDGGNALAATTHYISKSMGADSNNGTSKTTSWAHLPGMPSCTSNCGSYSPAPGDTFILYGGDTWAASDLGIGWHWSGSSSSCDLPYGSGATSSCIYIGVDDSWWNASTCGSSWCRPTFNAGANVANSAYITVNEPSPATSYVVFDNIEMTGLYNDSTGSGTQGFVDYGGDHIEFMHAYIHGWIIESGSTGDGIRAFSCQENNGGSCTATLFHDNVVDGADTDGFNDPSKGAMFATYGGQSEQIFNNYYRYVSGALVGSSNIIHDNVVEYPVDSFDGNHCNLLFNFGPASGNDILMYNNVVRHSSESGLGCVKTWADGLGSVGTNHTVYYFNNVLYDNDSGNLINLADHPAGSYGPRYLFNNTVECGDDNNPIGCGIQNGCGNGGGCYSAYEQNNHWIGPSSASQNGYCKSGGTCAAGGTDPPDLNETVSGASAQGYNDTSETIAFSPPRTCTSSTCGTLHGGTDLTSYCQTISGINAAAGTACQSSTTYGVQYDTTTHSVVGPGITAVARPSSGWNIGAYQCAPTADGGCALQAPPASDAGAEDDATADGGGSAQDGGGGGAMADAGGGAPDGGTEPTEGGGGASKGCGCRTAGVAPDGGTLVALGGLGVLLVAGRRLRRRAASNGRMPLS